MATVESDNCFENKNKSIFFQKKFIVRFLAIFLPVCILLFLVAVWVCRERYEHSQSVIMTKEVGKVRLGTTYLEEQLHEINQDVLFVASQFVIAVDNTGVDLDHIAHAWNSFITVKNKYDKIRFLDMSGMENIRVGYSGNSSSIVSKDRLQDRSECYYFQNSLDLNPNEIYVSPFDLNSEYGELEVPYKPVLRFATPVFDGNGEKSGVVIANYSGDALLTGFSGITQENNQSLWLVNDQGYWLNGPSEYVEWGFLTGNNNQTLALLYPDAWSEILILDSGQFINEDGLWTFSTVYPLVEGDLSSAESYSKFKFSRNQFEVEAYRWKVVSFIPTQKYFHICDDMTYHGDVFFSLYFLIFLCFVASLVLAYSYVNVNNLSQSLRKRVDELNDVTKALQVSERLYYTTLHSIGDAVVSTDEKGCVVLMNQVAEKLTGWKIDDALGKYVTSIFEVVDEVTGDKVEGSIEKVLRTGVPVDLGHNLVLLAKGGEKIPIADSVAPIIDDQDVVTGTVLVFIEQTIEREMQKRLEQSEGHFRSLFTNMPEGFVLLECIKDVHDKTFDYKIIQMNPAMENILDLNGESLIGEHLFEYDSDMDERWKNFYLEASKSSEPMTLEAYDSSLGGYYCVTAFSPAQNYIAVILENITERKDAVNKLEESQELLRMIIDTLPIRVFWKDINLKYLGANVAFAQDAGLTDPLEIVGKSDYELFRSKENMEFYRSIDRSVITRKIARLNFEESQTHQDGTVHDLITNKLPLLNSDGECVGVLGTYEDVTNYNRTKRRLQQLSLAIEQSPDAVVITDVEANIEYVNSAFAFITGYSLEESIGKNPRILQSGEHSEEFYKELWDIISSGKVWNGRFRNKRKDGSLYDDETTISSLKNNDGGITNYVALKRDITNELLLEEELHQASKMESIGVLAGGIAHQFNNLLQVIMGHNELLAFEVKGNASGLKSIVQIKKSTMKAAELTKELLTFSRQDFMNLKRLNINVFLPSVAESVMSHFSDKIVVNFGLSGGLDNIIGDERHLILLFENILENAAEAVGLEGKITVETYNISFSEEDAVDSPNIIPGRFVCCSVTDTGAGIADDIKDRIFEPFYSTKDLGAGLGLASAYGIIQKHNGWIDVESKVGLGSIFKVYLPAEIC